MVLCIYEKEENGLCCHVRESVRKRESGAEFLCVTEKSEEKKERSLKWMKENEYRKWYLLE